MKVKKTFTREERLRMLYAALDLCPDCRREFDAYAKQSGRDVFLMVREVVWRWFGHWPHGGGCVSDMPPEAPETLQTSSSTAGSTYIPATAQQAETDAGTAQKLYG